MNDFKRNVEIAIGAFKYDDDTWTDVFARVNAEGGIDNKRIVNVLIAILDELDKTIKVGKDFPLGTNEELKEEKPPTKTKKKTKK